MKSLNGWILKNALDLITSFVSHDTLLDYLGFNKWFDIHNNSRKFPSQYVLLAIILCYGA